LVAFALIVVAISATFAQTAPSRATQIRDHFQKAAAYLSANDTNSAEKEFNAVVALDPKNADAFANLGVIAFSRGDFQAAARNLQRALAIAPSLAKSQALLGICERRLGDPSAKAL